MLGGGQGHPNLPRSYSEGSDTEEACSTRETAPESDLCPTPCLPIAVGLRTLSLSAQAGLCTLLPLVLLLPLPGVPFPFEWLQPGRDRSGL